MLKTYKLWGFCTVVYTAAVDNLLCMNFWGTQWTMVLYFKNYKIRLKYKREEKIYQPISTADEAQFHSNRAGLAVLIIW